MGHHADLARGGRARRRARWSLLHWIVLGSLAIVAVVLGHIGYGRHFDELGTPYNFADLLYLDLRLFAFGSISNPPVPWQLEVARFLAPAIGGFSALKALATLFRDRYDQLRQLVVRRHVVVVGGGSMGHTVAAALLDTGHRVVVVEREPLAEPLTSLRASGAIVTHGDGRDPGVLELAGVDRARAVVVLCGDDGVNAEIAARVRDLARQRSHLDLTCLVHIVDPDLCELLRLDELAAGEPAGFQLDFLNVYEAAADTMAAAHLRAPSGSVVLLVGWSPLASHLVTALRRRARCGPDSSSALRFLIDAPCSETVIADYLAHHVAARADCQLVALANGAVRDVTHAYVHTGDDSATLQAALSLDRCLGLNAEITAVFSRSNGLASLAESIEHAGSRRVHAFVLFETLASIDVLQPRTVESIAHAIHDSYRRARLVGGELPADDPAAQPWAVLPRQLRESNREQARGIVEKLRLVNAVVVREEDDDGTDTFAFTPSEVEELAHVEHDRWRAERESAGWTSGNRDPMAKRTPYLVDWNDLSEDMREYDREAVRGIPQVLSAAGLRAVRHGPPLEATPLEKAAS